VTLRMKLHAPEGSNLRLYGRVVAVGRLVPSRVAVTLKVRKASRQFRYAFLKGGMCIFDMSVEVPSVAGNLVREYLPGSGILSSFKTSL
jgi:hypothetical protein